MHIKTSLAANRARMARWFLGACAAVFAASLLRSCWDPSSLVDFFFAQRVEREAMKVWQRRAFPADWARCRLQPDLCLNMIVAWPVTHPARGVSRYGTNGSQPILWLNDEQVPLTTERTPFTAIGIVKEVTPLGLEMVFLGTPQAVYGGTTWNARFGLTPETPTPRRPGPRPKPISPGRLP